VLSSAERIERLCMDSYAALYESDDAVLPRMGSVWRRVSELASLDTQFQPYLEARDAIKSQLEDLAGFLRRYAGGIDASPERLQQAEERLATLERLKRKHGPTLAEVLAKHVALKREALELERSDETVHALEAQLSAARSAYVSAASVLSRERKRVSEAFGHAMERELAELAMDRTRFEVRFGESRDESAWTVDGVDDVEFYISPNPGEDLRPVARIASGGELSRIMLAIKTLVATSRLGYTDSVGRPPSPSAPGLIFDEVDAGIGGRAADVVGRKLRTLGSAFQVLCITHLPQIAAYADTHFQIDKQVRSERAETSVRRLMSDARVEELSRMLGGAVVSDGLRQSAREMLKERSGKTAPSRKVGGESERAKAKGGRRKSRGA
jgi:DNA repair protein RecN (Recombination protein N)